MQHRNKLVALRGIKKTATTDQRGSNSQPMMNNEEARDTNSSRSSGQAGEKNRIWSNNTNNVNTHPMQQQGDIKTNQRTGAASEVRGDVHHNDTATPGSPTEPSSSMGIVTPVDKPPCISPERRHIPSERCRHSPSSSRRQLHSSAVEADREQDARAASGLKHTTVTTAASEKCHPETGEELLQWVKNRVHSTVSSRPNDWTSTHTREYLLQLLATADDSRKETGKEIGEEHRQNNQMSSQQHGFQRTFDQHRRLQPSREVKRSCHRCSLAVQSKPTVCRYRVMSGKLSTTNN